MSVPIVPPGEPYPRSAVESAWEEIARSGLLGVEAWRDAEIRRLEEAAAVAAVVATIDCPTASKTPWGTEAAAEEALAWILEQQDAWREKLPCRVYRCECGAWHLTSLPADGPPVAPPGLSSAGAAIARIRAAS